MIVSIYGLWEWSKKINAFKNQRNIHSSYSLTYFTRRDPVTTFLAVRSNFLWHTLARYWSRAEKTDTCEGVRTNNRHRKMAASSCSALNVRAWKMPNFHSWRGSDGLYSKCSISQLKFWTSSTLLVFSITWMKQVEILTYGFHNRRCRRCNPSTSSAFDDQYKTSELTLFRGRYVNTAGRLTIIMLNFTFGVLKTSNNHK